MDALSKLLPAFDPVENAKRRLAMESIPLERAKQAAEMAKLPLVRRAMELELKTKQEQYDRLHNFNKSIQNRTQQTRELQDLLPGDETPPTEVNPPNLTQPTSGLDSTNWFANLQDAQIPTEETLV